MNENVKNIKNENEEKTELHCDICGALIEDDDYIEFDGKIVCDDCQYNELTTCEDCGVIMWRQDAIYLENYEKVICSDCRHSNYTRCDCCSDLVYDDEVTYTASGDYVCEYCRTEYYRYCNDCGELIYCDDAIYDDDDDEYYCWDCYCEREHKIIHDYYYKPDPIFYKGDGEDTAFYMGVELEIDKGGEDEEHARHLLDCVNDYNEYIYIKHDGSIDNGFEIVSHPATLEYHTKNIQWAKLMSEAVNLDYRSHDTSTCGLHIHISRKAFGDTYESQEDNIAKIIYFIENNWYSLLTFTRRTEANLEHWAARYGIEPTVSDTYKKAKENRNRYKCINLQNDNTVEFRMFRGTLKYSTFIATLQFVTALCEYCINSIHCDYADEWYYFTNSIDYAKYPELVEYLKSKDLM